MPDLTADSVEQADVELGREFSKHKEHPLVRTLVRVGDLGDQEPLYTLAAGIALIGLLGWKSRVARLGVSLGLAVAFADLAKSLAKKGVSRTRPWVLIDEEEYVAEKGGSSEKREQSFPSGHTACSAAAALAMGRIYPPSRLWGSLATATVAAARLAKGSHWPLDVAAGLLIGWIAEGGSSLLLRVIGMKSEAEGR